MRQRVADGRPPSSGDTARFLGLTGRGGWLIAGLFLATQFVLAFTSNAQLALTPSDLCALVILVVVTIVVMLPGPYPLSHWTSVAIVVGVAAIVALVNSVLPITGWPGYESWQFGAVTMVLLALAIRGRIVWAWAGMFLMTALTIYWTSSTGQGLLAGLDLVDRNAGTLLIGTVFSIGIRRSIRWITALHVAEHRQASAEAFALGRIEQRRSAMNSLNAIAVPALTTIAESRLLAEGARADFLVIEAGLRDEARAPGLAREPLASTVRSARMRGQEVVLLDDEGSREATDAQHASLLAAASRRLSTTSAQRVIIRLFSRSTSVLALTIVEDTSPPVEIQAEDCP